jgi:hypothetical protein
MEPFFDGGMFELIIIIGLGYLVNFIFLKRYLLVFFSILSLASPVLLFFFRNGELFYFSAMMTIFNSILLVILLWKERKKSIGEPLFDLRKFREKLPGQKVVRKQDEAVPAEPQGI